MRFRLAHYLKTSLWFVPVLFVLLGIALSLVATSSFVGAPVPEDVAGDPRAALQILYLIAFAMLTLTGLVLSLVVVVVQLAMGVFSPRIVRQILQDRPSQCAIGLFAGTFAFAILTMRRVHTTANGGSVPGLAMLLALCLAVACIATLLWYIDHVGQSVRVAALVTWVAQDTIDTMDREFPRSMSARGEDAHVVTAAKSGVVFRVDVDRLVRRARDADVTLHLLPAIGDFVPTGAPLIRLDGAPGAVAARTVRAAIGIGPERTLNQDVAYGVRMLVDIAISSTADGLSDPTTAVQAIDRLHDVLRQLGRRDLSDGRHCDTDDVVRLVVPAMTWDGYVALVFDEIRRSGGASPQVARRLRSAIDDLLTVVPPERMHPLREQRRLLDKQATSIGPTGVDALSAGQDDPAGLGSAPDMATRSAPDRDGSAKGAHIDSTSARE